MQYFCKASFLYIFYILTYPFRDNLYQRGRLDQLLQPGIDLRLNIFFTSGFVDIGKVENLSKLPFFME